MSFEDWMVAMQLERIFTDLVVPMKHKHIGSLMYFVTVLDAYIECLFVPFVYFKS